MKKKQVEEAEEKVKEEEKAKKAYLDPIGFIKSDMKIWASAMTIEGKTARRILSEGVEIAAVKIKLGVVSVARYILVVEKETVLQRLANDKFCDKNHCIVITGRGYPDVPTRRFLRHLVEQLQLPVFCLVDSDPYGFDILTTYRFGSMQMAYDAKLMRVPEIRWLGVLPSEFEKYHLPDRCLLHLTPEDKKKVKAMMLRCYLHREAPEWRSELEIMLQKGVKFEIEALSVSSLTFLSEEYIPAKIQHGAHF